MIQILAAFVGTVLFALFFNISKNELMYCGLNGAIAWTIYLGLFEWYESAVFSSFVATLVVCIIAHELSKRRKSPVTIFQLSGIIPLVPGVGMYLTIYNIVFKEYEIALNYIIETIQIASAIAVAMLLVASVNKAITVFNQME